MIGKRLATIFAGTFAVLACAVPALAADENWHPVVTSEDEEVTQSVDLNSIQRDGDMVRFRELVEFKHPEQQGYQSVVAEAEMNCKNHTGRPVRVTVKMLDGTTKSEENADSSFVDLAPKSSGRIILDYVCGLKT